MTATATYAIIDGATTYQVTGDIGPPGPPGATDSLTSPDESTTISALDSGSFAAEATDGDLAVQLWGSAEMPITSLSVADATDIAGMLAYGVHDCLLFAGEATLQLKGGTEVSFALRSDRGSFRLFLHPGDATDPDLGDLLLTPTDAFRYSAAGWIPMSAVQSPDGTWWKIEVDDSGTLSTSPL